MSDPTVSLLEEALPPLLDAPPDWDDVLTRARVPRGTPLVHRALVAALAALVVAGGAFASSSSLRHLVGFGRHAGIVLTARLGNAGSVQLAARGLYIAHGRRAIVVGRLVPADHHHSFPKTTAVRWHVALTGAPSRVTVAVRAHRTRRVVATLCSPCADGAGGTLHLGMRVVQALFAGKGVAILAEPPESAQLRLKR
jgi:hypothetical protein